MGSSAHSRIDPLALADAEGRKIVMKQKLLKDLEVAGRAMESKEEIKALIRELKKEIKIEQKLN